MISADSEARKATGTWRFTDAAGSVTTGEAAALTIGDAALSAGPRSVAYLDADQLAVVDRTIDVGQTVAASFQTPTLFKIARDLHAMQIDTSVAEADIGNIKPGMPVMFSVDAFRDRDFTGIVRVIRLNPTVQQNVVTYNVVIDVKNEGVLLPGMTAQVNIVTQRRDNVLRVPNVALRFKPSDDAEVKPARADRPDTKSAKSASSRRRPPRAPRRDRRWPPPHRRRRRPGTRRRATVPRTRRQRRRARPAPKPATRRWAASARSAAARACTG